MLFNYDHHHDTALLARQAVHNLAMQVAEQASEKQTGMFEVKGIKRNIEVPYGVQGLAVAYEIDAMGNHFLEDSFAAGHAANPRHQVTEYDKLAFPFNAMLMQFQHDEDNHFGVRLYSNAHPLGWNAYGDGKMFDEDNVKDLAYIEQALKLSVDQVYTAYTKGIVARVGHTKIADLEPNMLWAERIKHEGDTPSVGPNGKGLRSHYYPDGTIDYAAPLFYANTIRHTVYARNNLRQTETARTDYSYHQLKVTNTAVVWACASHFAGGFEPGLTSTKEIMLAAKTYGATREVASPVASNIVNKILSNDNKGIALLVKTTYLLHGQAISSTNIVDSLCDKWWWF